MRKILCVDFDGVIHSYTSQWAGEDVIPDPPVDGALEWLLEATEFWDVMIYSSRSKSPTGRAAMRAWIDRHAQQILGVAGAAFLAERLKYASEKPPAYLTIDDRAICFEGSFNKIDPQELLKFKPWNKRGG